MRAVQTFRGKVVHGQVLLSDPQAWGRLVEALEGAEIECRLGKRRVARTLPQNAWYWGQIVPLLGEYCGYDREEMHEALKIRFLRQVDEHGIETVRSTSELSTAEFSEYAEHCRRLAAELGVVIPDPGMME